MEHLKVGDGGAQGIEVGRAVDDQLAVAGRQPGKHRRLGGGGGRQQSCQSEDERQAGHAGTAPAESVGKRRVTTRPPPSRSVRSTRPPCASTTLLTKARDRKGGVEGKSVACRYALGCRR